MLGAALLCGAAAAANTYAYLGNGFITAPGDLFEGSLTLAAAEAMCDSLPYCCGITFEGASPAPAGNVSLYLKSQVAFAADPAWQSYKSSRPCPPPCSASDGSGRRGECGPGFDQCGPAFAPQTSPNFHVMDRSCAENDPNFPLYDPLHKLYHLFYQDHIAETQGGDGQGPDIGHAVSADMVHWAHLPVAVWNDQPYDSVAIYSGSASIVNGVPTMIYPGLCTKHNWSSCDTGTLLALAVPADHAGDPLLTNWSKPSFNPIVNNTQRDPSSAWQTSAGEWRLTNFEGKIYSSMDFERWAAASNGAALFSEAECPDFFPVPRACDGNGCNDPAPPGAMTPTHVHKESSGAQDWYSLGVYTDGPVGSTGTWTEIGNGVPHLQPLDFSTGGTGMHFYASKSMYDPVQDRRIYYGWAREYRPERGPRTSTPQTRLTIHTLSAALIDTVVPPASTQTLPRDTRWHPVLQRLTFQPIPELAALRASPPLFSQAAVALAPSAPTWLGDWAPGAGNQSELSASFTLPTSGPAVTFGVAVLVGAPGGGSGGNGGNVSTPITFSFYPAALTLSVSVGGKAMNLSYYMPNTDMPGGDYNVSLPRAREPRSHCGATRRHADAPAAPLVARR